MSLTILVDKKRDQVCIVQWFPDTNHLIDYASGPPIEMSFTRFGETGYAWVCRHFTEYRTVRLAKSDVIPIFRPGEAKKVMKGRSALEISQDPAGNLIFSPKSIRRYDLVHLEGLGRETRRIISESASEKIFWATFDEVLAMASEN